MTTTTGSRAYVPGEDRSAAGRAKVVCQHQTGRKGICNGPVRSDGPVVVLSNVATLYQCMHYTDHRFAVWGEGTHRRVADVSGEKAQW